MSNIGSLLRVLIRVCHDPIHGERADAGFPRMRLIFSWAETRRRHAYIFVRLQNADPGLREIPMSKILIVTVKSAPLSFAMAALAFFYGTLPVMGASCIAPPAGLVGWWPGDSNEND